nr:Porin OmpC [Candidatus Pantoea persica]
MTALDAASPRKLHIRGSLGTRIVFLIAGLGIGSLAAMPVTGTLVGRFGCCRVMFCSTLVLLATLPLLAVLDTMWMMAATLMRDRLYQPDQPWLVMPRGFVAFLGFILFLAEGSVLDWGALLLLQSPSMSTAHSGSGLRALFRGDDGGSPDRR